MTYLLEDEADFVIVGTGAGGATAAKILSAAGHSVIMVEEGPLLRVADRPRALLPSMMQAFRDFGTTTTSGTAPIPLLQGRMVGGSTAINSGIIWRLPEDVRQIWQRDWGLGALTSETGLSDAFDEIERDLEVEETSVALFGGNSERMAEACQKMGLPGKAMTRNARRCQGTSQCLQGCPGEARQSMDVSYVPLAIKQGARLHAMARVHKVRIEHRRAMGVEGELLEEVTRKVRGKFYIRAKRAVIVAASVIYTPVILRKSGVRGLVGDRFQAHPGSAIVGRFDRPIAMGRGATQGYEVPLRDRGYKIETLALPPEMLATRIPGAGDVWQERLQNLDHYGQWAALVRMQAHGTVRPAGLFSGPMMADVHFTPTQRDLARMRDCLALICRMMFAAGAIEVFPGLGGIPEVLSSLKDVEILEQHTLRAGDIHMMASHLFGTAVAGADPMTSVVDPNLECHDVRQLYVMDASVFPTNLGVNPQHSIMALVHQAATRLANQTAQGIAA